MSEENVPPPDQQAGKPSPTRKLIAWFFNPWPTRKLIAWLVAAFLVLTLINVLVFDIGWAGVARGAAALFIVGGLSAIWNERRWRKTTK
jgi:hypothetical protein